MGKHKLVNYSIIFIALVVLVIVLKELASILRPLALAAFITILTIPIYEFAKRKKIPSFIPITGIFIILIVVSYFLVGLLSIEVTKFESNIDEYKEQIQESITAIPGIETVDLDTFDIQTILSSKSFNTILENSVNTIGNALSEIFLAILFAIFMIPAYLKFIRALSGRHRKLRVTLLKTQRSVVNYLRTKSIISLGTAASSALALALFNSDFVWTLSILIFLLNFIPNIGSIIATFFASALYLLKYGMGSAFISLFIILIAIQLIWGNLIEPHFAGKQLQLSPLLILISLFFWGWLWGIGGMIISVPILAVVKISLEHFESTKHIATYMQ